MSKLLIGNYFQENCIKFFIEFYPIYKFMKKLKNAHPKICPPSKIFVNEKS